MDGKTLFPTNQGTPQGGVLSPLLANIALHGMEERIKQYAETFDMKAHNSKYQISPFNKRQTIFLIRYADDFVVFHESLDVIKKAKDIISEWLSKLDLELKPSKTRISHTLMPYSDEKPGLNFLGFHIFQYKAGKCNSGKFRGKLLGFRTTIRPSKEAQQRHYSKIAKVIEINKGVSQDTLINILNPIIIGWCNYYKPFQSKRVFKNISSLVYFKLGKWGIRRHRNKGRKWLRHKYWKTIGKDTWRFCSNKHSNLNQLIKHQRDKRIDKFYKWFNKLNWIWEEDIPTMI